MREIHSYQKTGLEFLRTKRRAILADDMGLGKTAQALLAVKESNFKNVLVVCPKGVKAHWPEEIAEWLGEEWTKRFTIMGYSQLLQTVPLANDKWRRDPDRTIGKANYDCIIFDEAHKLKNRNAKVTKSAYSIVKACKAAHLYLLTGTPVLNRADELWSMLHMIDPKTYSSYWNFVKQNFRTTQQNYGNRFPVVKVGLPYDADKFKESMVPFVLRREKKDLGYIPPTYQAIKVDLLPQQKKDYLKMYSQLFAEVNGKEYLVDNALAKTTRLRQIAISSQLLDPESDSLEGAKVEALLELLEEFEGKAVIFSTSSRCVKRLSTILTANDYMNTVIHGQMSEKERTESKAKFIMSPKIRFMIMTIGAGGEGIDGLQHAASTVIFMDKDWTPAINKQAVSRVDRQGQKEPVMVYGLIARGTIESRIEAMLRSKQGVFDSVVPVADIIKMALIEPDFSE